MTSHDTQIIKVYATKLREYNLAITQIFNERNFHLDSRILALQHILEYSFERQEFIILSKKTKTDAKFEREFSSIFIHTLEGVEQN